jgi:hypothetical protein
VLLSLYIKNEVSVSVVQMKDFIAKKSPQPLPKQFENSRIVTVRVRPTTRESLDQLMARNEVSAKVDGESLASTTYDLKKFLDERAVAAQAVDLNVKLMKWRLQPELQLDRVQSTKVLLFGAGTLGCQLARNLIGWGIRHITFVDYGRVQHSNPVRQSLFTFDDAVKQRSKAEAAADSLKLIFPDVCSTGYNIKIPMPGHYVKSEEGVKELLQNVELIEGLVESHDAIYLLFDTREARWLPTLLGARHNKLTIAVGLGYDSYVIVRHGVGPYYSTHVQNVSSNSVAVDTTRLVSELAQSSTIS